MYKETNFLLVSLIRGSMLEIGIEIFREVVPDAKLDRNPVLHLNDSLTVQITLQCRGDNIYHTMALLGNGV